MKNENKKSFYLEQIFLNQKMNAYLNRCLDQNSQIGI